MPRALDRLVGAGQHIDAYQEYTQLVGRLDGGTPLSEAAYQELRARAADQTRRLYVNWRNIRTGLDCKAIGPQSQCFCGHRYNEHDWQAFGTRQVRCKMPGCPCKCFDYVPVRGSQELRCSSCKRPNQEHRAADRGCPTGGQSYFASSWICSCQESYMQHATVFESRAERESAGRPVDSEWLQQAAREGLPVCHMGGLLGFTSLADGIDRQYAGLEGDAVGSSGGAVGGGAGASSFMQRLQLEDQVNSAAAVHGRAAGFQALAQAKAKAKAKAAPRSVSAAPRYDNARGRLPAPQPPGPTPGRPQVHTLAGPVPPPPAPTGARVPPPAPKATAPAPKAAARVPPPAPKATAPAPKAAARVPPPAPKAAAPKALPPAVQAGTGVAGKRLGGARHAAGDAEALRQARLAKLDQHV
eukprot:gnl/TRDRNA2_/TRDRNA2_41066_c0_seq1.p1 gnl/TRDRNA2_/TRDRNA2_41066_c0~~gnl/TRDRNA2_/TRDRNA2_41066_c0_seq1.p1  ORF type:complete len:413 (+),score=71.32 gnl/TRDRNA2_/TRDRNA2_41066_c0_seq1:61-1299(+)